MPDVRKLRNFLKKEDMCDGDTIRFINAGTIEEKDFSKEQDGAKMKLSLSMNVSLNDEDPKELTLNQTSIDSLQEAWGPSTEKWIGKKAKVSFVRMMCFGKVEQVLFLESFGYDSDLNSKSRLGPALQKSNVPEDKEQTIAEEKAWDE